MLERLAQQSLILLPNSIGIGPSDLDSLIPSLTIFWSCCYDSLLPLCSSAFNQGCCARLSLFGQIPKYLGQRSFKFGKVGLELLMFLVWIQVWQCGREHIAIFPESGIICQHRFKAICVCQKKSRNLQRLIRALSQMWTSCMCRIANQHRSLGMPLGRPHFFTVVKSKFDDSGRREDQITGSAVLPYLDVGRQRLFALTHFFRRAQTPRSFLARYFR